MKATNSALGETVKPMILKSAEFDGANLGAGLPPASWNVIRLVKRWKFQNPLNHPDPVNGNFQIRMSSGAGCRAGKPASCLYAVF
jgi:hypothetical protein